MKNNIKKLKFNIFTFGFFGDLTFLYSFYNMMFIESGISQIRMSFLFIIMQVSKVIFDIPTGIIGDIYNRKILLIIAIISRMVTCIIWIVQPCYITFFIGMVLWGLAQSCLYCHTEAYMYDVLKKDSNESSYSSIIGKYYAIQNIAITIATFISGYIFLKLKYNGVYGATILSLLVALFFSYKLPNGKIVTHNREIKHLHVRNPRNFIKLFMEIMQNPFILRLMIFSALLDALFMLFMDLNTIIMVQDNRNADFISSVITIMGLVRIFTNYLSGASIKYFSFIRMNNFMLVIMLTMMFVTLKLDFTLNIVLIAYLCIYPFFDNSVKTKIQVKIDSKTRATVMSFVSLLISGFAILLNLISGSIAEKFGYRSSAIAISLIVIIIITLNRDVMYKFIYIWQKFRQKYCNIVK